jgi:hypothetical protein
MECVDSWKSNFDERCQYEDGSMMLGIFASSKPPPRKILIYVTSGGPFIKQL